MSEAGTLPLATGRLKVIKKHYKNFKFLRIWHFLWQPLLSAIPARMQIATHAAHLNTRLMAQPTQSLIGSLESCLAAMTSGEAAEAHQIGLEESSGVVIDVYTHTRARARVEKHWIRLDLIGLNR